MGDWTGRQTTSVAAGVDDDVTSTARGAQAEACQLMTVGSGAGCAGLAGSSVAHPLAGSSVVPGWSPPLPTARVLCGRRRGGTARTSTRRPCGNVQSGSRAGVEADDPPLPTTMQSWRCKPPLSYCHTSTHIERLSLVEAVDICRRRILCDAVALQKDHYCRQVWPQEDQLNCNYIHCCACSRTAPRSRALSALRCGTS